MKKRRDLMKVKNVKEIDVIGEVEQVGVGQVYLIKWMLTMERNLTIKSLRTMV